MPLIQFVTAVEFSSCDCAGAGCPAQEGGGGHDPRDGAGGTVHHHHLQARAATARQQVLWCQVPKQGMFIPPIIIIIVPFKVCEFYGITLKLQVKLAKLSFRNIYIELIY